MDEEYLALIQNNTWEPVPPPPSASIVLGKWIFWHKLNPNGSLSRYKARWVVRGFSQQFGMDYDKTFGLVVKPTTIRVVLSLAVGNIWPIHQLDAKYIFLRGHLNETIYSQWPAGYLDVVHPDYVCRLSKA